MNRLSTFLGSTALVFAGSAAFADLTAEQTWDNQSAYLSAMGYSVNAVQSRNGDVLTITNLSARLDLPLGVGFLTYSFGQLSLTENGDGTVTITVPDTQPIDVVVDMTIDGENAVFTLSAEMATSNFSMLASGDPSTVTYVSTADTTAFTSNNFEVIVDGERVMEIEEELDWAVFFQTANVNTTTVIDTSGSGVAVTTDTEMDQMIYDVSVNIEREIDFQIVGGMGGITSHSAVTLPANGMDLMNLSPALRARLSITSESEAFDGQSQTIIRENGTVISNQSQTVESQSSSFSFDQNGLSIFSSAQNVTTIVAPSDDLPIEVVVEIGEASLDLSIPLLADTSLQAARFALRLADVNVSDEMWSMADRGNALPHEPVTIDIDVTADILLSHDLLDFVPLFEFLEDGGIPVELHGLTLTKFDVDGLGVIADATGAFVFDNNDLQTFGGFPAPQGSAEVTVQGANTLMDSLVTMGMLGQNDIMGARMMMGMFANVIGDDIINSVLEVTADGHIFANGQQLQ
ncbi:MAG: hypothetical protein JKX69_04765 [Rhodobacteraceae bacterium]|nr:hypothetical protein [Paracoccaceae bacterium]